MLCRRQPQVGLIRREGHRKTTIRIPDITQNPLVEQGGTEPRIQISLAGEDPNPSPSPRSKNLENSSNHLANQLCSVGNSKEHLS